MASSTQMMKRAKHPPARPVPHYSHTLLQLCPVYPQFQHTLPSPFPLSLWPVPPLLPPFLNLHSLPPRLTSSPPLPNIVHQLVSAGVHSFFTHWFHCGGCGYVISFLLPFMEVCRRGNSGRNRVISWPFSVATIKTSSTMMLSSANRHQQCDSFVPRTVLISKPSGINFLTARVFSSSVIFPNLHSNEFVSLAKF